MREYQETESIEWLANELSDMSRNTNVDEWQRLSMLYRAEKIRKLSEKLIDKILESLD